MSFQYIITLSLFFSGFAFSIETNPDKALKALKEGGKIVLIRHAFAPGIEGNIDKKGKEYIPKRLFNSKKSSARR